MDMQKSRLGVYADIPAALSHKKLIVGAKQLRKALRAGTVRCVYLAENADPAITQPLAEACEQSQIPCHWISSMRELGHACGIDVGTAAAAIVA